MGVPETLYQRALKAGFTLEAACSLLSMVQGESAFRADNAEDRINGTVSDAEYVRRADAGLMTYNGKNFIYDAVGFGYIQWTFWSRKKGLLEFCKNRGASVADPESQKEFIFYEMQRDFPAIWNLCRTSHDLHYLCQKMVSDWENPANHAAALAERYPYAQAWYAKFSATGASSEPIEKKSVTPEIVRAVLNGEYGNNQDRIDRLTAAGYDAGRVQAKINQLYDHAESLKSFIASCEGYYELVQDISGVL